MSREYLLQYPGDGPPNGNDQQEGWQEDEDQQEDQCEEIERVNHNMSISAQETLTCFVIMTNKLVD